MGIREMLTANLTNIYDEIGEVAASGGRTFKVIEQSDALDGGTEIRYRARAADAGGLALGDAFTVGEVAYRVEDVTPLRQTGEVMVRCSLVV